MPIKYSRPTLHSCPLNIQHQLFILNICKISLRSELYVEL
jgi:hypothetical protein